MACDQCKISCVPYTCTIGGLSSLCSYCYAKLIRAELVKVGYDKGKLDARIGELTGDPDKLEQWMGVCGFAACIREVLYRKDQAQDLFEAAFHHLEPTTYNNAYRLPNGTSVLIPFPSIMGRLSTAVNAVKSGVFVDWILCRALTHVLKVVNRSLYNREVAFSDTFNMADWNEDGHFAIQTDSLTYVARSICGLKVLWVLKHDYLASVKSKREVSPRNAQATASLDAESDLSRRGLNLAKEMVFMLDGSTSMFTAIHTGHIYTGWTDNKATTPDSTFTTSASTGAYTPIDNTADLPFNHWVVINGATLSGDKKTVEVDMWTWHTRRKVTYKLEHLTKYLREAIFVKR